MTSDCTIISIDGNIGAGKSTVLKDLERRGYIVFPEDIDTWKPLLEGYYTDPHRWAFTLQTGILDSLNSQHVRIKELMPYHSIIFMERAPSSSKLFADISREKGYITEKEYNVYAGCYKKLVRAPDIKLFIDTDVDICLERIKRRGRECERDVDHAYLKRLSIEYKNQHFDHSFPGEEDTNTIVEQILKDVVNEKKTKT